MYKAIIADDEKKVCQLIRVMGNWEALGIEIVDICHSGDDAWESIQKYEPDIVLTDIRMPVYDGLQIINKVNEKYGMSRNISFIIISGYAEFEYARQAIQYNIVNYLLKPLDKAQLNEALQKACNSLSMKQQQVENEQRLLENKRVLQANCVSALQEMKPMDEISVEELNRQYCTVFQDGCFVGIFFNFPFTISRSDNLFLNIFVEKLRMHFGFCYEAVLKTEGTSIYVVLNYCSSDHDLLLSMIRSFYKKICEVAKIYGECQIHLGIGECVESPREIRRSLIEAEIAELSRVIYEDKQLISYGALPKDGTSLYQMISVVKFKELEQLLEQMNTFEVKKWFSENLKSVEKERYILKNAEVLNELRKNLIEAIQKVLGEVDEKLVKKSIAELNIALKSATSFDNYLWIIKSKTVQLVEQVAELVSEQESYPISVAKQYVQQHFSEPVTLTEVAQYLSFSSVYFGNIFKKHTGKSFSAYLTDVRMENAKKYLKMPQHNIAEVAGMVGYQDVKYFSKTFKATYGVKPTEYKKMILSMQVRNLNI